MGDLLYFACLDTCEYFGDVHKETEWRLNTKSLTPLIDLLRYGRWSGKRIILCSIIDIEQLEKRFSKFKDISKEVYE